jgi:hypothetical protein
MKGIGSLFNILAALGSIGAGVYLLQYNAAVAGGTSWFQIIGHGMGIYFVAKGVFIGRALWMQETQVQLAARLVEFAAAEYDRRDDS